MPQVPGKGTSSSGQAFHLVSWSGPAIAAAVILIAAVRPLRLP